VTTGASSQRIRGYQGYSPEELARTTTITRDQDPRWRWVFPVTRSTRDFIIEQMPALYAAYGVAIGLILATALVEGGYHPPLLAAWLAESGASIAVRSMIQRRMVTASPVEIASRPALRVLPVVGIALAAIHWSWTAVIFIGPTLTITTVVVLLTFAMLSVACMGMAPATPVICVAYIVPMWSATVYQLFHARWTTAAALVVIAAASAAVLWAALYIVVSGVRRYLVRSDEVDVLLAELRRRNDEVERLREMAASDLETRSAIFASASHDLRQRVHALKLLTQFGGSHPDPRLTGSIEDLELYMTELLHFVRLDASAPPSLTVVALQDVFQRVELAFEDEAAAALVSLRFRATNVRLYTDCASLVRIVENLVSNAIKFSRGRVLVAARRRSGGVDLDVWDQGPGPSTETTDPLRSQFGGITHPAPAPGKGFGLGLTIVRRLTAALGYQFDIRSVPHRGTRARITIPASVIVKETEP